jgi:hypothetical protein
MTPRLLQAADPIVGLAITVPGLRLFIWFRTSTSQGGNKRDYECGVS